MASLLHLVLDPNADESPLRTSSTAIPSSLPAPKSIKAHPTKLDAKENASIFFVGTATTIVEWECIRFMTDPNFLHAGDHVHLGPGVTATRKTNPALDLDELPRIDFVLLSHYHGDHFDQEVEAQLRRSLPIITTPHAKSHLAHKEGGERFTAVHELEPFRSMMLDIRPGAGAHAKEQNMEKVASIRVTGMPGKHVAPKALDALNDIIKAVSLSFF
jgi:L-ascorbate metabolism protein UlaG (beta-lactamase superfamily)